MLVDLLVRSCLRVKLMLESRGKHGNWRGVGNFACDSLMILSSCSDAAAESTIPSHDVMDSLNTLQMWFHDKVVYCSKKP